MWGLQGGKDECWVKLLELKENINPVIYPLMIHPYPQSTLNLPPGPRSSKETETESVTSTGRRIKYWKTDKVRREH